MNYNNRSVRPGKVALNGYFHNGLGLQYLAVGIAGFVLATLVNYVLATLVELAGLAPLLAGKLGAVAAAFFWIFGVRNYYVFAQAR